MKMRKKYYFIHCFVILLIYHSTHVDGACEGEDTCKCQKKECMFVSGTEPKTCKTVEDACSGMKFKENQCQRKGAYYSWAGAVCKHDKDAGNCDDYEKLVKAINFGGKEHTDVDGITYEADQNITYSPQQDPRRMKKISEKMDCEIEGIPKEDKHLYQSHFFADKAEATPGSLVMYRIALEDLPGEYELTIKFVDPVHDKPYKRNFALTFNNRGIMKGQDIVSHAKKKCAVFTIHVPFTIKKHEGKPHLFMFGQTEPREVYPGNGPLSFRAGDCGDDITFVASAMSLKYLGPNGPPPGKPKTTKKPGPATKKTTKKPGGGDDDDYTTPQFSNEDDAEGKKKGGKATTKRPHTLGCKAKEPTKASKGKAGGKTTTKPAESEESDAPIGGRTMG